MSTAATKVIGPGRGGTLALGLCCAVAAAATAATASAAAPTKGASYVGELSSTQTRVGKRVVMNVSKSGHSATARLSCNGTRFGTLPRFKIKHGRFTGVRKAGTSTVWRLRGHFVSSASATAKLWLPSTCDGKGGAITLTRTP
jgi:hypothetical protein